MIIKAYGVEDAANRALKLLKYRSELFELVEIQQPVKLFWGLMKRKGYYEIRLKNNQVHQEDQGNNIFQDGCVQVLDGKVTVTDPTGTGAYAAIYSEDPNIEVYINNKKINNGMIVMQKDSIELIPKTIQPVTEIGVKLSKDEMKADLTILREPGRQYYAENTESKNSIYINSGFTEIPSRCPTLQECIDSLTATNVKLECINQQAIIDLLETGSTGNSTVAVGRPAVPGISSKIQYFFKNEKYRNPDLDTDKIVNLLDYFIRPTAKIGDVLAVKLAPPIPGRDGLTVTGKTIKALSPEDTSLRAGYGTVLLEDSKIVADINGRPSIKDGVVYITSTMVIQNDVDASTGNIVFDGDIDIYGDVKEGSRVKAGGDINVFGNIYNAFLVAKGDIRVQGIVMNGKVTAGYNVIQNMVVLPKMENILAILDEIFQAISKRENGDRENNIGKTVFNIVIKENTLNRLVDEIKEVFSLLDEEDRVLLSDLLEVIENHLTGMNALHIKKIEQIMELNTMAEAYVDSIRQINARRSNVYVDYCQNSLIQASESILLMGQGCYRTNLISNNSIVFIRDDSVIRGGTLIAGKKIKAGIVGSSSGIRTYCRVLEEKGEIETEYCYANTSLNVNGRLRVIQSDYSLKPETIMDETEA